MTSAEAGSCKGDARMTRLTRVTARERVTKLCHNFQLCKLSPACGTGKATECDRFCFQLSWNIDRPQGQQDRATHTPGKHEAK